METGDFDQTPAPSGRPSLTTLRSEPDDMITDAAGISASRAAAFRHHLLKTSASGPTLVDRDLPAPPLVSRSPPIKTPSQSSKSELENRDSFSGRTASALPRQISPVHLSEKIVYSSPIRLIDRECVNPSLYRDDTHADAHHPGLLEGADFCDNGVRSAESRSFISSTHPSSPISDDSMMSGEVHRVLSSGDISVTEVTVPTHRHKGHSIAVKVRPAFSYYPMHHPVLLGDQRGLDYSRSAKKVQPFDPGSDHLELRTRQDGNTINGLEAVVLAKKRHDGEYEGDGDRDLSFPTSKLRAFVPELPQEDDPQYYSHKPKVRPYTGTADDRVVLHPNIESNRQSPPINSKSEWHATVKVDQSPSHAILERTLPKRAVGEFETMLSCSNGGPHIQNEVEQQSFGGEIPHECKKIVPSQHHIIHSPIPVSKVRPIFTAQPSSSGHDSHSSASKVRSVQEKNSAMATQDNPYFQRESGQSLYS